MESQVTKTSDILRKAMLQHLHVGQADVQVHVRVLRFFNREVINHHRSATQRTFKEVASVDYILADEQGTHILAAIYSDSVKDELMPRLVKGRCFTMKGFTVLSGGQCVHERCHLVFTSATVVEEADSIPKLPTSKLITVSDLPWRLVYKTGFFDLCGYVRHCSPLRMNKHKGYCEKELTLMLETCMKGMDWAKDQVTCVLRGSWVEEVERQLLERNFRPCSVFVVLRCVISTEPTALGMPMVSSIGDATTCEIDPTYPEVQSIKQQMMCY